MKMTLNQKIVLKTDYISTDFSSNFCQKRIYSLVANLFTEFLVWHGTFLFYLNVSFSFILVYFSLATVTKTNYLNSEVIFHHFGSSYLCINSHFAYGNLFKFLVVSLKIIFLASIVPHFPLCHFYYSVVHFQES